MCGFRCLLRSVLPDMRPEDSAACSEHNMSAGVMRPQDVSTGFIDGDRNISPFDVFIFNFSIQDMQDDFADFQCIFNHEFALNALNLHRAVVMLLASRCGVNGALVQNEQVFFASPLFLDISENIDDFGLKFVIMVVFVVQIDGFRQVCSVVKHHFGLLCSLLLTQVPLVVEITGNGLA